MPHCVCTPQVGGTSTFYEHKGVDGDDDVAADDAFNITFGIAFGKMRARLNLAAVLRIPFPYTHISSHTIPILRCTCYAPTSRIGSSFPTIITPRARVLNHS